MIREYKAVVKTVDLCCNYEISDVTFYTWMSKSNWRMAVSEASMLNVIDEYGRKYLGCIVDTLQSGRRVVRELRAIAELGGCRAWFSATMAAI